MSSTQQRATRPTGLNRVGGAARAMLRERFNGVEGTHLEAGASSSLPLLMLFALSIFEGLQIPGTGVPVNSVALILAVGYAVCRPSDGLRRPTWFPLLLVAVPGWLLLASLLNGPVDTRRVLSISLWAAVALVLSSGRLPLFAVARGVALGLVVISAWATVTIGSSSYEGRLTGWFGDPNTAGLFLLMGLCISIPYLPRGPARFTVIAVGLAALALTLSRTSWLAAGVAVAWMILGGKINRFLGVAGVAALVAWVVNLPQEAVSSGVFAGRAGSDQLRQRILAQEEIVVAQNPWIGNGAGSARVTVDELIFFFHNSYLAVRAEAGWIGFILVVGLLLGTFLALLSLPVHRRSVWMEAALVVLGVCSANLGESLLAVTTAMALGMAGHHLAVQRRAMALEREQERMQRWARRLANRQVAGNIS